MFTDIEGSTRLFHDLGDEYPAALARHQAVVREALVRHNGHEVKTEGDSFFVAFWSTPEAVAACVDVQRGLAAETWPANGRIRVRIGLHTGIATPVNGDYVSLAVHRAARVSDAGHGGQILLSAAAVAALGTGLPDGYKTHSLGRYRLRDFDEPEPLSQIEGPDLEREYPALRAMPVARHNVRTPPTRFIGRRRERTKLLKLLHDNAVVSVIAQGGTGKSRLAAEVAIELADEMDSGSVFVELGALTDEGLVAARVVAALGGRVTPERSSLRVLADTIAGREMLLVLDEAERVPGGVSAVVEAITAAAPATRILITSRQPLDIPGEEIVLLEPLTTPDSEHDPLAATTDAVAMLIDRLGIDNDSTMAVDELEQAVALCRRLDGLPLAIELAAARVPELGIDGVVAGLRTADGRQTPVQDAIRLSYDLLGPGAQRLFRRLRWLASPSELDAIRTVVTEGGLTDLDADDVSDLLTVLAERSLVRANRAVNARVEYRMLETVREVANDLLNATDDADALDTSLVEWAADQAMAATERRKHSGGASDDYTRQLPTFLAALDAGQRVQHPGTPVVLLELAPTLVSLGAWNVLGERGALLSEIPGISPILRSGMFLMRARSAMAAANTAEALQLIGQVEAMFPELPEEQVGNLEADMANDLLRVDPFKASKFAEHALPIVEKAESPARISALHAAGATRMMFGNFDGGREAMQRCLDLSMAANDQRSIANALASLGNAAFSLEDFGEAVRLLDDATARFRRINAPTQLGPALAMAGHARALLGQFDEGIAMLQESLELRERFGDMVGAMFCKLNLADSFDRAGRKAEARALFADAYASGGAVGIVPLQQAAAHGLAITATDACAQDALTLLAAAVHRNIGNTGIDAAVTEAAFARLRGLVDDAEAAEAKGKALSDEGFAEVAERLAAAAG